MSKYHPPRDPQFRNMRSHRNPRGEEKHGFESRETAEAALAGMDPSIERNVYQCPVCSKWHIGRAKKARR